MIHLHRLQGQGSIYLIRHGESEGYAQRIIKGRLDLSLSSRGRRQADKTGRWLKTKGIQALLSSPLARAAQTAEIIGRHCGLDSVSTLPELIELDTGIFSGLSPDQAKQRFPEAWRRFQTRSWGGVPRAERNLSLLKRANAFWNRVFTLVGGGARNIAAVTHTGIMQWIIKSTLGHRRWLPLVAVEHCGIYMLRYQVEADRFYCSWDLMNFTAP
jgi:broad specificity phosphatase PhoE